MSKAKTTTLLSIIGNGIKLYVQNIFVLTQPVIAPVFGLFASTLLMLLPIYFLPIYYPVWAKNIAIFNELWAIISIIILTLLPGLIIFKLAFWNYMLKMVSINNIIGDILKRKVIKHHTHYTQIVALRTKDYLLMLLIWCLMILMGLSLPLVVFLFDNWTIELQQFLFVGLEFIAIFLLSILSVYLSLSFQVFSFQTELGPMQTLEESFRLVLNNFWRLIAVAFALCFITTILIPEIFVFISDVLMIKNSIAYPFQILLENSLSNTDLLSQIQAISLLPNYDSQDKLILEASKLMSTNTIRFLISLLMLPLGSCFYTLFYFDAQKRNAIENSVKEEKEEKPKKATKKTKKK